MESLAEIWRDQDESAGPEGTTMGDEEVGETEMAWCIMTFPPRPQSLSMLNKSDGSRI